NEGFALAVAEEFVVFTIIALLALWIDNQFVWNVWLGAFIGLTFHYVVHIGQAIVLRKYIPALATSIVCLPISIYILKHCFMLLTVDIWQMAVGVVVVAVNLVCAHKMTKWRL
ncbi:MAG: HXXEE domain-containing protein, partial [Bacteroidales bacterium]|nr:HXXEE domain-containing protein [Bacteroidales bacterium]